MTFNAPKRIRRKLRKLDAKIEELVFIRDKADPDFVFPKGEGAGKQLLSDVFGMDWEKGDGKFKAALVDTLA